MGGERREKKPSKASSKKICGREGRSRYHREEKTHEKKRGREGERSETAREKVKDSFPKGDSVLPKVSTSPEETSETEKVATVTGLAPKVMRCGQEVSSGRWGLYNKGRKNDQR